jgi:diguanylate cyclase (GGDEF)-like protein
VVAYLAISLVVGWGAEMLHQQRARAELLALTDDLTNVPNRRRARMFLESEFQAARAGRPLSIVMFDLDAFKLYNDTYGHAAGDNALCNFSRALLSSTRPEELSARYGGEEFMAVLPTCDLEGALTFVQKVRSALRAVQPEEALLTVSAGVACFEGEMRSSSELIIAADKALYQAKKQGRDAVRVYQGELSA